MFRRIALLSAASVAAIAGSVMALQPAGRSGFDQPLTRAQSHNQSHESSHSGMTIIVNDDGDTYELRVDNDKVTAKVNGEAVPSDRIRRQGDQVAILDEDGEEVYVFNTGFAGGETWVWGGSGQFGVGSDNFMPLTTMTGTFDPPKVMIGINRSEPDAALMEHLGVEPGIGVRIDRVYPDLPAAKAGLEANDIIIAIDDSDVTAEGLRDLLDEYEPGDTAKFTVIRKGERKQFKVKFDAYDAKALGVESAESLELIDPFGQPFAYSFGGNFDHQAHAKIAREMAEIARKMAEGDAAHAREHAQALQELAEEMARMSAEHGNLARRFLGGQMRVPGHGGAQTFRLSPDGSSIQVLPSTPGQPEQPFVWNVPAPVTPTAPASPSDDLDERLDRLEQKLERLERLLEKLDR